MKLFANCKIDDLNATASGIPIIDLSEVVFEWDTDRRGQVCGFVAKQNTRNYSRRRDWNAGACYKNWLHPSNCNDRTQSMQTPEGVFASIMAQGVCSSEEFVNVLYQFARVDGLTWAQRMLYAAIGEVSC